uniref:Uncharacterized protein n=1 Tax=Eptatretus burgeri TaxID=7764 RepID=A0A8C4Q257_EPTBU
MKKLVSIPKNDVKNKVAGFEELPISSTFRDLTNVPKQSCNVMNPKNTNNCVEQHQTGSLTPTGNIRKRLNFEDNPPTPESSAMTTLLKQNGSSTAFSQKSTDEFFNSSMMIQSELLNLKYSAILHAEPCSEDEFVIEEETENNHFSFLPLLGSVHHCHQMSSVSVSSNEHDDSIIQSECTNKKIEQTNTTKHAPKKSGKNSNDLQKAKLTTRSSAIAKPTSLDLKAGIEVEHLPRKKRVTAGDSKVVAAAKSWTTGSTVSVPDNREAPGCAAKKRKKNVSYNNDDKNGSQDDETGLQRKQKSQQMQKSVRSKKLETCVTRSTTARVLSPFEKTCSTQNLIPNNNSLQPSSPPDEPSPSQRKRQVSSYQHLARQASPSKQSKRVPDRLASPSRSSPDRLAKTRRPQGKRKDTELGEKSCVESVRGQSDNSSIPNQRVLQKRARSTVKAGVQKSKGQRKDKEGFNYHPNQKQQKASSLEVFEEEKREEEMYLLSTSSVPMDENTDLESDFNSSVTQSEDTKLEYSTVLQVEPCSEDEFVIMDDTEENNFCISTLPGSLNHCNPLSSSVSVSSNGHDGSIIQRECTNKKAKQANTTKHVPKKSGKNCKSVKKAKLTSVTTRSSAVAKPTSLDLKAGDEIEHLPRKKRVTSGNSNVVADEKSWKTGSTVSVRNNREAPGSAAKKRKKNVSHTDDSKNASQDAVTGLQRKQKSQQLQRPLRSKKLETCVTQSTARVSSPFEETCPTQNLIPNNDSFQPRSPPDQRKRQVSNFQHFAQKERPGELSKRSPDRLAKTRHLQRKRKDTELGENSLVEAICDQSDDNLSTSDQRVLQKRPRSTVKVGVRKSKSQSKSQESFNRIHNQKERKARSAKVFEEQEEEEIYFSSTNSTSMDENRSLESDNDNSSIPDQMVLQKRPRSTVKTGARKPKGQSKNQEVFNHRRSHRQQKASSAKVFEEQQEEEMYLASTSSTSTLDEDHDLESETMLSSPGPSHNPKRPVLPSMTPGMRRSQRLRVPPLEHWRGERIEYVHKSGENASLARSVACKYEGALTDIFG